MKRIYLDFHGKKHSLYDNLINYPPSNYEFVTDLTSTGRITKSLCKVSFLPNLLMNSLNQIVPISILKPYIEKNHVFPKDISLVYSSGHVILNDIPWVMDMEFVTHLAGYSIRQLGHYKRMIQKALESENCRRIMPWTDAGKKTILSSFDSDIVHGKVETVRLAVPAKIFKKDYNKSVIKILFVASQNLPKDFDVKGGKEVLEAFRILNNSYDNLQLIIRSYVPQNVKDKYSKFQNIIFIDKIIPWSDLDSLFKESDIFLFPSHNTPGLAILDAMSYELPIITTDLWGNNEMITDGKNGLLIGKSKLIRYYDEKNYIPLWGTPDNLKRIKMITDMDIVMDIVEKSTILIENESLRRNMGKLNRSEIEFGKFSVPKRNEKLIKIFDQAVN
jgi:glycosyltransferase involved in cell wall biosynthesis